MSLGKIFGLYTICFLRRDYPHRHRGDISSACRRNGSAGSSWHCRSAFTSSSASSPAPRIPDQYYVAGRGVPAVFNGMATGSDWMSAASFISMAGALSAQGFAGLAYVMGWTGGYLLLAVFLGPYLRQFGAYTIPDFLGARYGGNFARIIGVVAAITCSFTYLIAQVTGVGLIVSRFIGLDFQHRRLRRPDRRALLLGAWRHEIGHVDSGCPVYHPDRFVPGSGRLSVLSAFRDCRSPN